MNNNKKLSISNNKKVLAEYDNFRVRELPENFLSNNQEKIQLYRTQSKMIYLCREDGKDCFYEVFINFLDPVPIRMWIFSLYDYLEIYPDEEDFETKYRSWRFVEKEKALEKYLSLE